MKYLEMNNQQEVWKQIPMYPTYAASNLGRIKNIKKDTIMAQKANDPTRDYQRVCISYQNKPYTKKIARLVWAAFNGCECEQTINHIDGDPKNNHVDNLECISIKENCGKRNIYRKKENKYGLTDEIRKQILTYYLNKEKSVWKLAQEYNIPTNYLYTTFKRGSWNHLCWKDDIENTNN